MATSSILDRLLEMRVIDVDESSEVSYGTPWTCVVCGQAGNSGDSARCAGCRRVNFQLHSAIQRRLSGRPLVEEWKEERKEEEWKEERKEERKEEVDFSQLEVRNVDEFPCGPVWRCEVCGTADIDTSLVKCPSCGRLNFQLIAAKVPRPAPPTAREVELPIREPHILDFATLPLAPCQALKNKFWECQVCKEKDIPCNQTHCSKCNRVNFPAYAASRGLLEEKKAIEKRSEKKEKSGDNLNPKAPADLSIDLPPVLSYTSPEEADRNAKGTKGNSDSDKHTGWLCCSCQVF